MSSPDVKNDAAPKWASNSLSNSQRIFLMGKAIYALTLVHHNAATRNAAMHNAIFHIAVHTPFFTASSL